MDENLRQGLTTQLITARQQQAALAANKHGIRSEESQVQAEANSIIRQTRWHKGIDRLREEKAKLELSWAKPRRLPTCHQQALEQLEENLSRQQAELHCSWRTLGAVPRLLNKPIPPRGHSTAI